MTAGDQPLVQLSATALVEQIASGALSAAETLAAHLERIAVVNPVLNAFVQIRGDAAMAEAVAQDAAAARGVPRGRLGGVPITVKSAIEVAGLRCETGSPSRAGMMAANDATLVARVRAAGAIVLGTTNVAEMLMAYESDNPLYGRTSNPWELSRTAGGSSGGEAAAIAAGCSAGGVGSDGGGSIRVPAHFCGICGLKPTPGRIPSTGHQPPCTGPFALIGVVGPMARTIADLSLMLDVMAGADEEDPMAAGYEDAAADDSPRWTIGYFEDDGAGPVTRETADAVVAAARAAERAGYTVERFRPSALDGAQQVWRVFFGKAGAALLHDALGGAERHLPILQELGATQTGWTLGPRELLDAWLERDRLRAALLREMRQHRVLICPVAAMPAFRHGERRWTIDGRSIGYIDAMVYTQWFNILGNPAAVVPAGRSPEGLPIGVQVVGRPYEERRVLAVAAAIERECGGYTAPPPLP